MASSNTGTSLAASLLQVMLITMLMMVCIILSMVNVYEVGDSAGWTSMGDVGYQVWASNYTFQVGDILVFNYNKKFHDVAQVSTSQEFQACNASSPIARYTSGSDMVTLDRVGHFYFLCGVPGHCQAGQKLDVLVGSPDTTRTGILLLRLVPLNQNLQPFFPLALSGLLVPILCFPF